MPDSSPMPSIPAETINISQHRKKGNCQKVKSNQKNRSMIRKTNKLSSEQLKMIYFKKKISNAILQRRLMLQEHNIKKKYYEEKINFFRENKKN